MGKKVRVNASIGNSLLLVHFLRDKAKKNVRCHLKHSFLILAVSKCYGSDVKFLSVCLFLELKFNS